MMEVLAPLLCILVPTIAVAVSVVQWQRRVRNLLQPLADVYQADLPRNFLFRYAEFQAHNVLVRVDVQSRRHTGSVLVFTAPINDAELVCRIRPLRMFDSVRRWIGHGVSTGQGGFDDLFWVAGRPAEKLRVILDVAAQAALISLYSGIREVVVRDGVMRVTAVQPSLALAEHSLVLLSRFLGLSAAGVEFLDDADSGPVRIRDETACPVCAEKMEGSIVYCQQCQMPHHKDCWKYAGGCAIYGCGSRRNSTQRRRRGKA